MDTITLAGVEVFAHHGVYEEERKNGQTFIVDVTVTIDLRAAGQNDDLAATLHYGDMADAIHHRVSSERWDLIERVAERVAELVLEDGRVERVEVTVHKPQAPIKVPFGDVSVTITRTQ